MEARLNALLKKLTIELANRASRVKDLFAIWDVNEDGLVDIIEFHHALLALGIDCTAREANALFSLVDVDGMGHVEYNKLHARLVELRTLHDAHDEQHGAAGTLETKAQNAIALRVDGPACNNSTVLGATSIIIDIGDADNRAHSLASQLKAAVDGKLARVKDLFEDWDHDGDRLIEVAEFRAALAVLGVRASRKEATELFESFDLDQSGKIEYKELYSMLRNYQTVNTKVADDNIGGTVALHLGNIRDRRKESGVVGATQSHRRLSYRPAVPLRDRLIELLPRAAPRVIAAWWAIAEADGTLEREVFTRSTMDIGSSPSDSGTMLFNELVSSGCSAYAGSATKFMRDTLRMLFDEICKPYEGDDKHHVPVAAIIPRIRKLQHSHRLSGRWGHGSHTDRFPPLASPRVARASLMPASSTPVASTPHSLPHPPASSMLVSSTTHGADMKKMINTAHSVNARTQRHHRHALEDFQRHQQSCHKWTCDTYKNEFEEVHLPSIISSSTAVRSSESQIEIMSHELQVYQRRGAELRNMMNRIESNPDDPQVVQSALTSFIRIQGDSAAKASRGRRRRLPMPHAGTE